MNPTRRHFLAGLSAMAVAPVLVACGSDDESSGASDGASTSPTGDTSPDAESVFPVSVTHKYGETTIEAAPQRVVCVGLTDQDSLLALGIVPVGVTYWFGDEALNGIYPWAQEALGDGEAPTLLRDTDGIQIEQIAGLQPDLIVGQYSGMTQQEYDTLSELCPVVAQSADYADFGMPWQEASLAIGTAVGKATEIQAIIDDAQGQILAVADEHPEFAGQTAAVATPYEGLFLYGPEDPRSRMLLDFGFDLHPLITDADDSEFGVSVSPERTSDLGDIGVAVWLDLQNEPQVQGIWDSTTAATEGRQVDIGEDDGSYYVAHSFITPLSIPYLLEQYVPQLAAAADGDPATEVPAVTS